MTEKPALHFGPGFGCSQCGAILPIKSHYTTDYFVGKPVTCTTCHASLDWWKAVLREIRENLNRSLAFAPVGASLTAFPVTLRAGERTHYRLADHDIPAEAKILRVHYSPDAPVQVVELRSSTPTEPPNRHEVTLWPVPLPEYGEMEHPTEVVVSVTWVFPSPLDVSWTNLISASEAYALGDYPAAIIPANVAVEAALSMFLTNFLTYRQIGKKHIEDFLVEAATYGHQDRKSTRLNSSHLGISYAVFCLKK